MTARLTVALTFDHDAISAEVRRGDGPMGISRGEFGPRVGVRRILELLQRESIPSTWFIPGHTVETFPESVAAVVDAGHELACHGWLHEDLTILIPDQERAVIRRAIDALTSAWGRAPRGFRAPYWGLTSQTLAIVQEFGFAYDSSLMDDDVRLHRVRLGDVHDVAAGVSRLGTPGRLIEAPISWSLDDWPHFEPGAGAVGPMSAPSKVLEIWLGDLRYAWEHEPGGVLTITMHPEAVGRGSRMAMLERFIAEAKALEGVVFDRLDAVVERWEAANPIAG
ncbi:MAG: polysaccharide deacetylase, partial [Candidatus Limnocylindrales bacterium]